MSTATDSVSPQALRLAAIDFGLLERGGPALDDETLTQTLQELENRDIDHGWGEQIETCTPPSEEATPPRIEERRTEIRTTRYDRFIEADIPMIFKDSAGIGKTTNVGITAWTRDRPHALLFDKHAKGRDQITKDIDELPDEEEVFHLKGQEQPRHACCMDADGKCDEHGPDDEWPLMCPVSEQRPNSTLYERFNTLASIYGHAEAHRRLPVPDDCAWQAQFGEYTEYDVIVGVHEHQHLFVNTEYDVILDETPRLPVDETRLSLTELKRAAIHLHDLSDGPLVEAIAEWIDTELADALVSGDLSACEPPTIDRPCTAENLARLKVEYNETLAALVEWEDGALWDQTQPWFDEILATLAEVGFHPNACRAAIAGPSNLHRCPRCKATIHSRSCVHCYWERDHDSIIDSPDQRSRTRTLSYIDNDKLCVLCMPDSRDLPQDVLVLDATATPEKIKGIYGTDRVIVEGDEQVEMNAHITQIKDGQYHASTIKQAAKSITGLATRIQRAINLAGEKHERPLYIIKAELSGYFDFPDNGVVMKYGSTRGLDFDDCDAVMIIGALHPNMDGVRRQAELLARYHPELEVGGLECSNRDDGDLPPRKKNLNYRDEEGKGRRVPTKAYSGLVGKLFEEVRENEIEQSVHRLRPIFAAEQKHVYILTNVPTELPIDKFVKWEEFIDPPVPEDAIDLFVRPLVEQADHDELEISTSELYDLVGDAVSGRTVRNWVGKLRDAGIVEGDCYASNSSKRNIVDVSALRRIIPSA